MRFLLALLFALCLGQADIALSSYTATDIQRINDAQPPELNSVDYGWKTAVAKCVFDPSGDSDDRSVGAHTCDLALPKKAVVTGAWYKVLTEFASAADSATLAIKIVGANDVVSAVAINADSGTAATGTVTISDYADLVSGTDDTIEVGGVVFTAQSGAATPGDPTFRAATSNAATATSLATQIEAYVALDAVVSAADSTNTVLITSLVAGTTGNDVTLVYDDNDTNVGATLTGSGTLTGGLGPWSATIPAEGIPKIETTSTWLTTTAVSSPVTFTVGTQALTAGKLVLWVQYRYYGDT